MCHLRYELVIMLQAKSQCKTMEHDGRFFLYWRCDVMSLSRGYWNYQQRYQIRILIMRRLQDIRFSETANQTAICELDTIWPGHSNARDYCCQLSTKYQILGDLQWIANPAAICELDTIWPRHSNAGAYRQPAMIWDRNPASGFHTEKKTNRCIEQTCRYYITPIRTRALGLLPNQTTNDRQDL